MVLSTADLAREIERAKSMQSFQVLPKGEEVEQLRERERSECEERKQEREV